jgi:catechol 2,3-dioxygenase-like lactoylglutathione lyase family enzyme
MATLKSVSPVCNEDMNALPVKELDPAIAYYKSVLGFAVVQRDDSTAVLVRQGARIALTRKADHQPREAGSLAFEVDDLEALHAELSARGGKPGEFDTEEWGGRKHRTFFMREDENGYCYCFYRPVQV